MRRGFWLIAAAIILTFAGLAEASTRFKYDERRGSPAEYDPGPAKGSEWVKLYGSAPNYRLIGREVLSGSSEKFRWAWGPMWYRGRLEPQKVKVFVVGQEGAQDENVSNRAFTGSTGTKTQKLLNYMGVYESYLFMNTFVYTINGQLEDDPNFKWLEQQRSVADKNEELLSDGKSANCYPELGLTDTEVTKYRVECGSPVVDYRHLLFDNMARTNNESLNVVLGVGSGGKASVATWINHVVGEDICEPDRNLANCNDPEVRRKIHAAFNTKFNTKYDDNNPLVIVGVPHPGGASPRNGGLAALRNIVGGFEQAARTVKQAMDRADSNGRSGTFLPADPQEEESRSEIKQRLVGEYSYGNAPVPFKDFAFGTNWRMGDRGTTSNRRGSQAIQVFSYQGKYNNDGHEIDADRYLDDDRSGLIRESIGGDDQYRVPGMKTMDLAYEPPVYDSRDKDHADQYDYGPCDEADLTGCTLSRALQEGWPNFDEVEGAQELVSDPSFGHGPVYRGKLVGSEVLVVSDQLSHDDFFSGRALTGLYGQRVQQALYLAGAEGNYGILRTLPVDTLREKDGKPVVGAKLVEASQRKLNELIGGSMRGKKVLLTIGDQAKAAVERFERLDSNIKVINADRPTSSNVDQWKEVIREISRVIGSRAVATNVVDKYTNGSEIVARPIPRVDLPYSTRWWMGTSGDRVERPTCTNCEPGGTRRDDTDPMGDYYTAHAPSWVSYDLRDKPRRTDADEREIDRIKGLIDNTGRSATVTIAFEEAADKLDKARKEQPLACYQQNDGYQAQCYIYPTSQLDREFLDLDALEDRYEGGLTIGLLESISLDALEEFKIGETTELYVDENGEVLERQTSGN